ncbi:MAG: homocysteine S-methyltransferase family protein, partial [Hyphomicrobiaceae bacterium]
MPTAYETASQRLNAGGVLLLDGGVSTELQRRGVPMADDLWSGRAALDYFEAVVDMHCAYIDAGADVITANTYASSRLMLEPLGISHSVSELNRRSVEAALMARDRSGARNVLVAGSLSHATPRQIRGASEVVSDEPGNKELFIAFQEMASILSRNDVDVLLLEMMSKPNRMTQMFDALSQSTLPVWCGLSAKRNVAGDLIAAHDTDVAFHDNVVLAAKQNFDAWGIMHTSAELIGEALVSLRCYGRRPLMVYPDSGYMAMPNWQFVDDMTPETFAQFAEQWEASGA